MTLRLYYGIAAITVMQLLGPRPVFVKTAYAADPATMIDVAPAIDATAADAPAVWTAQDALFGFDGDGNALTLVDTAGGNADTAPYGRVATGPCD